MNGFSDMQSLSASPMRKRKLQWGFNLTELMIVIAIIGIMLAVALPTYQNHVIESRRKAAQACLMELSQFMERYFTTRMTYAAPAGVDILPQTQCRADLATSYTFSLTPGGGVNVATQYTLNAVPLPGSAQAQGDAACGTLTLNQAGTRGAAGANCWL